MLKTFFKIAHKYFLHGVYVVSTLLLIYFLTRGITLPYVGYNSWNFNTYSLIAHNYNAYGYWETKFVPITSVSKDIPKNPEYYLNHPPLLSLLQSLSFKLFGESFASGRLPVVVASIGSFLILIAIAKHLKGKKYAAISAAVFAILPASSLFGRMIGQEPLVLFFALITTYFILLYQTKKKKAYIFFATISSILGVLSDWPMVYFSIILGWYLWIRKLHKEARLLVGMSIATAILYFFYTSYLLDWHSTLIDGFLNRSLGNIVQKPYWVVLWVITIVGRVLFYFNPLLFLVASWYFAKKIIIAIRKKHAQQEDLLFFVLFTFGVSHILLYPEGSYGHPYWTYYLLPFIVLAGSAFVLQLILQKRFILLVLGLIISLSYVFLVDEWKTREVQGNVFRYDLARLLASEVPEYESVAINRGSLIDQDVLRYRFGIQATPVSFIDDKVTLGLYQYYVHTCWGRCGEDIVLFRLDKRFSYKRYIGDGVEMQIFFLKIPKNNLPPKTSAVHIEIPDNSMSIAKYLYNTFMRYSSAPQL